MTLHRDGELVAARRERDYREFNESATARGEAALRAKQDDTRRARIIVIADGLRHAIGMAPDMFPRVDVWSLAARVVDMIDAGG